MDLDDTARVLRVLAGSTGRTIGKSDVLVWSRALHGRDPNECIAAIEAHIADPTTCDRYLMPGHVIGRIEAKRRRDADRRKNDGQLRAIESAKSEAADEQTRREAIRLVEQEITARREACADCDAAGYELVNGKPTRERCTHPNVRRAG